MLTVSRVVYSGKAVALDNTLESFALGGSCYVDELANLEQIADGYLLSKLGLNIARSLMEDKVAEFDDVPALLNASLFKVALQRLGCALRFLIAKSELHSAVAVSFFCFDLGYRTRTSFNDGTDHRAAIVIKYGGHADFPAEYSAHCNLWIKLSVVRGY